ncbi:MAG: elongation factor G, partial [Planctomycetota bacterium]
LEIPTDERVDPLRVEPGVQGSGNRFVVDPAAASLPKRFRAAVEEGVAFGADGGLDLGFPLTAVTTTLLAAVVHDAESTELAFGVAGGEAFREASQAARLFVLELVMRFEVTTPTEFVGPIQGDLARRGAVVEGEDVRGDLRTVRGTVALSGMFGYSTTVRSLSQGRASYSMEPAGFREVPPEVARRLAFLE